MTQWAVDPGHHGAKQVYPLRDLKEHLLERPCWCNPSYDEEDDILIHNAADEREKFETGERKPS